MSETRSKKEKKKMEGLTERNYFGPIKVPLVV